MEQLLFWGSWYAIKVFLKRRKEKQQWFGLRKFPLPKLGVSDGHGRWEKRTCRENVARTRKEEKVQYEGNNRKAGEVYYTITCLLY